MQTEPNKPELKLAMAKLLPEMITTMPLDAYGNQLFKWSDTNNSEYPEDWFDVTEREWLYVMHLIEQTLTLEQRDAYAMSFYSIIRPLIFHCDCYATFNQRATAMCRVKGINLV